MRRVANGVRNYIRAAALSNGGNVTTLAQQVAVILAKYGTDAHVYLPGIGVINGLTAGNYLDSAGTTAATVDNPVGLVLDAGGNSIARRNLLTYTEEYDNAAWTKDAGAITANAGDDYLGAATADLYKPDVTNVGSHRVRRASTSIAASANTFSVLVKASGYSWIKLRQSGVYANFDVTNGVAGLKTTSSSTITSEGNGFYRISIPVTAVGNNEVVYIYACPDNNAGLDSTSFAGDGTSGILIGGSQFEFGALTAYQKIVAGTSGDWATGIHAIQSTTANKPVLRQTSGRYWWDMVDGTDLLTATYPAGWESVTTIDAAPTGQATLTAQNIVGSYAINTDTYGRLVFKSLTASELATMQTFANRLAGL